MLIVAAVMAIFVYGMIAAMLGSILPDLSKRFSLSPSQNGTIAMTQAIGLVIGLELVNTSIEALVDRVSPEHSELARVAKDTAAGAVLVGALTAMAVGACVFAPHWGRWFGF